jgi:hypothetical protein
VRPVPRQRHVQRRQKGPPASAVQGPTTQHCETHCGRKVLDKPVHRPPNWSNRWSSTPKPRWYSSSRPTSHSATLKSHTSHTHQDKSLTAAGGVRKLECSLPPFRCVGDKRGSSSAPGPPASAERPACVCCSRHTTQHRETHCGRKSLGQARTQAAQLEQPVVMHTPKPNGIHHFVLRRYFEITSTHQDKSLTAAGSVRKLGLDSCPLPLPGGGDRKA